MLTTIREIERELGRLRDAETAPGQAPNLRTSVMTHIAWVPERWQEAAKETLQRLEERHPSRTILLFPEPDAGREGLEAEVDLRCFRSERERAVCSEVIVIRLGGERASAPASVVLPLLISDLPVFLRWRGPLGFDEPAFEQLTGIADRLVADSREWPEPRADFARLPSLFDRIAVSDIAWARIEPWREALAALWPVIADASRLRVAGPEADGLLLAHWLGARLGRDVELELEPAGEVELVAVDGVAARPRRLERRSPSDLLSAELEVFGRDPIYEEALRSFASVAT